MAGTDRCRVVFNALALQPQGTGVQTYARELLAALVPEINADLAAVVRSDAVDQLPRGVSPRLRWPGRGVLNLLQGARGLGPADLVHGLDVQIPARHKAPAVVTVHDLAVCDVPWAFSRRWVVGIRAAIGHAMRHADAVIADSTFTADRIHDLYGREAIVIPLAPSSRLVRPKSDEISAVRRRYDLPSRFVLYVGTIEPRKDTVTLARACQRARLPLILAGRLRRSSRPPSEGRMLGYVPESDLPALYGAASVTAYPSVYEGFGLPPLEAMACAVPVVAYRIPPVEEVVADAAVLTTPRDVDELAAALTAVVADEERRASLIRAGLAQVSRFNWAATAASTVRVYRSLDIAC